MKAKFKVAGAIVVVLAAVAFVNQQSFDDEEAQAQAYCLNVAKGVWPDYEGRFDRDCKAYPKPAKKFREKVLTT